MKYQIHTLKNGLRIVLAPTPETKTATVIVMTGTGSRYENERENGLAHFLEHMFFKGTKRRKKAKIIAEELEGIGGVYNAYTAKDRTAYWAKVESHHINTALDVVSDIFLNSTLPEKEIQKERGTIIQEIDMYEDMPMRTVDEEFDALMFNKNHPLGRTVLGPKENIRRFTRSDFKTYHKRNYVPANTVVCIAGSFSAAKVLAKIKREFAGLKHKKPPALIPFTKKQDGARIKIKQKKTDQTHFILGVPAYPLEHKDETVLSVLTTILGSGMSSRLFTEVREKRGLAYSVHAWTERYPDTGYFAVQAGVAHDKLEKTISVILGELKKIKNARVSVAELKKAKDYMKGRLALSLETSDSIAGYLATSLITRNKIRMPEETVKQIDKVTAADIERVAGEIFRTESLNLAIIGPHTTDYNSILKL